LTKVSEDEAQKNLAKNDIISTSNVIKLFTTSVDEGS
jgi:hypothetical protein